MPRTPVFRLSPALLGLGCALALGTTFAQQSGTPPAGTPSTGTSSTSTSSTSTSTGAGTAPAPTTPSTPGSAAPVTSPAVICGLVGQGSGGTTTPRTGSGTTGSASGTTGSGGTTGTASGTTGTGSGSATGSTGTSGTGTGTTGTTGNRGTGTGGTVGTGSGTGTTTGGTGTTSGSTGTGTATTGTGSTGTGSGTTGTGATPGTTGTGTSGAAGTGSTGTTGTGTGGTTGGTSTSTPGAATSGNTSGARLSNTDTCFAQQAALSNLFEIQSSQLAGTQANSAQVKNYAQQMIRDHTAATRQLSSLAPQLGLRLPTALEGPKVAEVAALRNQRGAAFDRAYVTAQVNAHEQAVNLFRLYSEQQGANPQLKAFATQNLPVLRQHLESARNLLTRLAQ